MDGVVSFATVSTGNMETAMNQLAIAEAQKKERNVHEIAAKVGDLTFRQFEVLSLMAQSFSNQDIALQLKITVKGVEWHQRLIFQKLQMPYGGSTRKRTAIAVRAYDIWSAGDSIDGSAGAVLDVKVLNYQEGTYKDQARQLVSKGYRLEKAAVTYVLRSK